MNKYRLKFTKTDKMVYIGHLDLLKFFQRSIKRSGVSIDYSKGFNPHQLVTFAIPLSLGASSLGEYVDIQLKEEMPAQEVMDRLNSVMTLGIEIKNARKLEDGEKSCAAAVNYADYSVTMDGMYDNIAEIVEELLAQESIVLERTVKKKVKSVDIRPLIKSLSVDNSKEKTVLNMCIATGSQGNLKVDLLMEYVYEKLGKEFVDYKNDIERLELYTVDESGLVAL